MTTPTPAPIPSGSSLIELMRKAMVARRTARVSVTAQSTWTGHSVLAWSWMDMDLQANALSISVTVERRELVLSGEVAASREPGRAWYGDVGVINAF